MNGNGEDAQFLLLRVRNFLLRTSAGELETPGERRDLIIGTGMLELADEIYKASSPKVFVSNLIYLIASEGQRNLMSFLNKYGTLANLGVGSREELQRLTAEIELLAPDGWLETFQVESGRLNANLDLAGSGGETRRRKPIVPRISPTPIQRALIGREEDLLATRNDLNSGRKFFFHGAYGVGKTSFMIELFSRASAQDGDKFADGFLWHTARGLDVAQVTELIASDFSDLTVAQAATDQDKIDALRRLLSDRKQLLIGLDDVDSAHVARAVLDSAGQCALIFNGQRSFNLHGQAAEVKIQPLSSEEARMLFVQQAALDDASLTQEEQDRIHRICEQMHNLPLAVELAARKVAQGESLQILELRLQNSPVSLVAEHGEVGAIFNEIYADLERSPTARRLLVRLACFASFEAPLQALLEDVDGSEFFEAKDKIIELGLASPRDGDRVALHPLLGLLIKKQADQEMLSREQAIAASWLINQACNYQDDYFILARDHQNFVGLLDWYRGNQKQSEAVRLIRALFDYLRVHGHWHEAIQRLEEARAAAIAQDAKEDQAWINLAITEILILRGEYDQALENLYEAQELYDAQQDGGGLGQVRLLEGRIATLTGEPEKAIQLFQQAILLMGEDGPVRERAEAHTRLANLVAQQGDVDEARDHYKLALTLSTQSADLEGEAEVRSKLGHMARRAGSTDEAMSQYQRAIQLAEELGDKLLMASLYMENGYLLHKQGMLSQAEKAFNEALIVSQQLEHDRGQARAHHALGLVFLAKKDNNAATAHFNKALSINQELGNSGAMAGNRYQLALVAQRQRELQAAGELYRAVLEQAVQLGNVALQAACKHQLGRIALESGDMDAARSAAQETVELARRVDHLHLEALAYLLLGRIDLEEGNDAAAWIDLNKAKIGMIQMRAPQLKNVQRLLSNLEVIPGAEMKMEVEAFSSNFVDQIQESTTLLFDSGDVDFARVPEAEYEEYEDRASEDEEFEEAVAEAEEDEEYEEEEEEDEEFEDEEFEEEEEEEE